MKELILAARDKAGELADRCGCMAGKVAYNLGADEHCSFKPCPSCARLREIASWCWHEVPVYLYLGDETPLTALWWCSGCGKVTSWYQAFNNKPLTIPQMLQLLCDMGLWEKFKWWLRTHWHLIEFSSLSENELCNLTIEDILTDEELLATAITSFLKEGKG
jgi:hypothetical protein